MHPKYNSTGSYARISKAQPLLLEMALRISVGKRIQTRTIGSTHVFSGLSKGAQLPGSVRQLMEYTLHSLRISTLLRTSASTYEDDCD